MKRTFDLLSPLIAPGEEATVSANLSWRRPRGFELVIMRGTFLLGEPSLVGQQFTIKASNQGDRPARLGVVVNCDTDETTPQAEDDLVDFAATWPPDETADEEG